MNKINGRIYHPKNEYSINKNIKNTGYLCYNFILSIDLFSAGQSDIIKEITERNKEDYYCTTLIKGHNERYLLNVELKEEDTKNSHTEIKIIDSYANKTIFSLQDNIPSWIESSYLYNFGNYIVSISRSSIFLLKINHDKFPQTDNEDGNLKQIYKYNEYYSQ